MSRDQNPMVQAQKKVCHCAHAYEDHHNSGLVEGIAGVCEFFGCNEEGGLDDNGNIHCLRYIDMREPDEPSRTRMIFPSAAELVASQTRREEWVRQRRAKQDALVRKAEERLRDDSKPIEIDPDEM
jgi:hypothetical protein